MKIFLPFGKKYPLSNWNEASALLYNMFVGKHLYAATFNNLF